jgi:hypothetical protein
MRTLLVVLVLSASVWIGPARAGGDASAWYVELKRAAKYARIAATVPDSWDRLEVEDRAARRQLELANSLPIRPEARIVCKAAAQAVVDFIHVARTASGGRSNIESGVQAWDTTGKQCLDMIHDQQALSSISESAAAGDQGLLARDIRRSEKLVVAALRSGNRVDLARQRLWLFTLAFELPKLPGIKEAARLPCGKAASALADLTNSLDLAASRLEAAQKEYPKQIVVCEKVVARR